jgi:hypothetical protein
LFHAQPSLQQIRCLPSHYLYSINDVHPRRVPFGPRPDAAQCVYAHVNGINLSISGIPDVFVKSFLINQLRSVRSIFIRKRLVTPPIATAILNAFSIFACIETFGVVAIIIHARNQPPCSQLPGVYRALYRRCRALIPWSRKSSLVKSIGFCRDSVTCTTCNASTSVFRGFIYPLPSCS